MNVVIRQAQQTDEPQLRDLYEVGDDYHWEALPTLFRTANDPIAARDILGKLAGPDGTLLVAEETGCLVGLAAARLVEIGANDALYLPRRYVYVDDMVVLPDFRGRGIGQSLLAAVEVWAKEQGAETLELTVFEFNEGARRLYERSGFVTQHRRMRKPI